MLTRAVIFLTLYAFMYIYMVMHVDIFHTLADATRRLVIDALRNGERQVNDIVQGAGIDQSGVSRHLRILHEAGFVSKRPDGQRRFYALRPERFRELDAWVAQYRGLWEARLDRFGASLAERHRKRTHVSTERRR
jgi:DNA-binding transcriptional ArsR family regulator